MRSGAGAFCPRSRRLECLLDFFTRALLAAEGAGFAALRVAFPDAEGADHTAAAARSNARAAVIDVRSLISALTMQLDVSKSRPIYTAKGRDWTIGLLLVFRRYDTWQEDRKGAVGIATAQYLEHYVVSGL